MRMTVKLKIAKKTKTPRYRNRRLLVRAARRAMSLIGLSLKQNEILQIVLVNRREIARLNETFVAHEGPTDVITFDLRGDAPHVPEGEPEVAAEIYVCVDVARDAADRYSTGLAYEVVLYIVHGLLHLSGEDDQDVESRSRMRSAEKRTMSALHGEFPLDEIFETESR